MSRCLNFAFWSKDKEFPDKNEAPIDILPDELLIDVLKRLPLEDLVNCEAVCRRWRIIARDPALWRHMPVACSGQLGQIPKQKLSILSTHSDCIRVIKIQYILNYHVIKSVTENCHNLTTIELIMCRIEKEFENDIMKWKNLQRLNLKNSLLKSDTDLVIQYDQFKNLEFLGLSDFGLFAPNCESLLNCTNLNTIYIDKIRGLTLDYIKRLIKTKQSTLIGLHIYGGSAVDDECLFMLAQCPMLKDIAILRCEDLTDKALVGVASIGKLQSLQLWNNNTFSESMLLATLKNPVLIKLRSLSLSRVQNVTSSIVDVISEYYKDLRFLALYQCPRIVKSDYEKQLKAKFRNIDVVLY